MKWRTAQTKDRPRPQHKRVWAEMTRIVEGEPLSRHEWLFAGLAVERDQRDPERKKTLVCLLDRERSLWDMQRDWFERAIGILDIFHVSERIWGVAHCFYWTGVVLAVLWLTILALADMASSRAHYTKLHSQQVAENAVLKAQLDQIRRRHNNGRK